MSYISEMKPETARVLAYLREYVKARNGMAPALNEVSKACYMSINQVRIHLEILEARGFLRREPRRARAIWLIDDADD
ncbi:MAG: hypothetical protein IT298_12690 [Chloroflexi bacterium]|jgi:DNA-binding MarR family transcriptional regulator|nr:MAG: LexA repressor [Chloroflexi bacterium OLB13]MBC6957047.1 hypothetical protein [Chloroflexota bacterium]MBV6437669.1 LexA repressor [Anaerolineae bacterium]MDL1917091.1 hypothetical protein [Anaerolineae bacterium CFX4]OQY78101.1 MAG: hypothetical protein B6D42_16330 [Anaerolineae bacterium UTCFX5]